MCHFIDAESVRKPLKINNLTTANAILMKLITIMEIHKVSFPFCFFSVWLKEIMRWDESRISLYNKRGQATSQTFRRQSGVVIVSGGFVDD